MKEDIIGTECYRNAKGEWLLLPHIVRNGTLVHIAGKLSSTASDEELGRAQRDMLKWCDEKYVDDSILEPQVKATGLKSWKQFYTQWLAVSVDFTSTSVTVWPSMRLKVGAYQFLKDLKVTLPIDVDDATLGATIRAAAEQCTVEGKKGVSGIEALETGDKKDSANTPQPFGYKCIWLAVKSADPKALSKRLGLTGVKKSTWEDGIEAAYEGDGRAFVSPPLDGWVLVVSSSLPAPGDDPVDVLSMLRVLSREYGEVQYFCTHRVIELHSWAKAVDGQILRAYGYSGEHGEVFWNEGELTPEERELGFGLSDEWTPDEEDVLAIAAKWSIDTSFSSSRYAPAAGLAGEINLQKLAKLK